MKTPAPERQNVRIIRFAARAASFPLVALRAVYGWGRALRERLKTPQQRYADERRRQSRIRRGLRGLGTDHVQEPAKPA